MEPLGGERAFLDEKKDKIPLHRSGLGLNFIGATWATQFMHSCMLRRAYKKTPGVLDQLVEVFARDMEDLLLNGISKDGCVIRIAHLGTKGDLPALSTLGHMEHTFRNAPKAAKSKKPCEGICWMCRAGSEVAPAVPYEDFSISPLWEATLGQQEIWRGETPPILLGAPLPDDQLWSFYKTDVWHNFHMGVGKFWVAGGLVGLLENLPMWDDASMEERLQSLNTDYHSFCMRKRVTPHVEDLGRETLGWPTAGTCPCGSWSKGSATTHFMIYRNADACKTHPLLSAIVARIFCNLPCLKFLSINVDGMVLLRRLGRDRRTQPWQRCITKGSSLGRSGPSRLLSCGCCYFSSMGKEPCLHTDLASLGSPLFRRRTTCTMER